MPFDAQCATVTCPKRTRCKNGKCIPRKHKPKKMICTPLGFKLKKHKCWEIKEQCKANPRCFAPQETCGFHPRRRMYKDFSNPCDACLNKKFRSKFYYEIACEDAPVICSEEEECLNGLCVNLPKEKSLENNESCNFSTDCEKHEECVAHLCIAKVLIPDIMGEYG